MKTRRFSIEQVLQITDGHLFTDMREVYDLLNWMTNDSLMTHALLRAREKCAPILLKMYPFLAEFSVPNIDDRIERLEYMKERLRNMIEKHRLGTHLEVPQIDDWNNLHPLEEPILDGKNVIVLNISNKLKN